MWLYNLLELERICFSIGFGRVPRLFSISILKELNDLAKAIRRWTEKKKSILKEGETKKRRAKSTCWSV